MNNLWYEMNSTSATISSSICQSVTVTLLIELLLNVVSAINFCVLLFMLFVICLLCHAVLLVITALCHLQCTVSLGYHA